MFCCLRSKKPEVHFPKKNSPKPQNSTEIANDIATMCIVYDTLTTYEASRSRDIVLLRVRGELVRAINAFEACEHKEERHINIVNDTKSRIACP